MQQHVRPAVSSRDNAKKVRRPNLQRLAMHEQPVLHDRDQLFVYLVLMFLEILQDSERMRFSLPFLTR